MNVLICRWKWPALFNLNVRFFAHSSQHQTAAARGDDVANFPVYTCGLCPPCFVHDGDGCKPACTLDTCDLESGQCSGGGSSGATGAVWDVVLCVMWCFVRCAISAVLLHHPFRTTCPPQFLVLTPLQRPTQTHLT